MKQVFILRNNDIKRNAANAVLAANENMVVEIKKQTRSNAQNRLMWSILNDLSKQVKWIINDVEQYIDPADWKDLLTIAVRKEQRRSVCIDDGSPVFLGTSTRELDKEMMAKLIEIGHFFGDSRGVIWSETSRS